MRKLYNILLLLLISISTTAQEFDINKSPMSTTIQEFNINKSPNAWRIIATNITAVSLEAIGDGLRDNAWITHNSTTSTIGHISQAMGTGLIISIPLGQSFTTSEWFNYVASYILTRIAIFDPIYNTTRGLPWDYHGGSSLWDIAMDGADPGDGLIVARGVTFIVSVSIPLQIFNK